MQAEKQHTERSAAEHSTRSPDGPVGGQSNAAEDWLSIQCNMIRGATRGLVFQVSAGEEKAELEASWPERNPDPSRLLKKVQQTLARHKTLLEEVAASTSSPALLRMYHPLSIAAAPARRFVAVLEMHDRDGDERRTVANLLRWNSEWLKFMLAHEPLNPVQEPSTLFPMVASCLDQEKFRGTAMTLVTELATHFGCHRVSFGLRKRRHIEVQVLSHSASFKHETNLIQTIGAAMDEAVDQDQVILYSAESSAPMVITHAHAELASHLSDGTVCTLPVTERGEVIGALTLERDLNRPFKAADLQLIEQLLAVVAPLLSLKQRDEQSLPTQTWRRLRRAARRLFGPAHIKLKVMALASVLLVLFLSLVQGDWRVTADAVVEGSVQRTIAAPIDGYIATAAARAGDVVELDQEMGALEDSDLRLQRLKWSTLRQQMVSESREAMAQHDRAEVSIINARIEQADAELELLDEQLSRTRLLAPFDGIVIEGDLSQLLGTPVTRGETLFKVAPLDDYRIVLRVDERDIAPIQSGQVGKLVLASMPDRLLALRVNKIVSVSTAERGRNYFRVEAGLVEPGLSLRPGMEGVGKIQVGEASLFRIWTRELFNWLRLQAWTWWR